MKVVLPSGVNHTLLAEANILSTSCSDVWLGKACAINATPPETMGADQDEP